MRLVAYITDLFFESKLGPAVQELGGQLKVVSSIYKFFPELEQPVTAVLVDLAANGISPTSLIAQVKTRFPQIPVIAFGDLESEADLMERAGSAGADQVVDREDLIDQLGNLG